MPFDVSSSFSIVAGSFQIGAGSFNDPGFVPATPPYTASAVHFDGATWLINAALSSTDNATASVSYWAKKTDNTSAQSLWASDPAGNQCNTEENAKLRNYFGIDSTNYIYDTAPDNIAGAWHHIVASVDFTGGSPVYAVYLDDVLRAINAAVGAPQGTCPFNGLSLWVGKGAAAAFIGDVADLWIAPGVSLLSAGAIPTGTRRKFIDGAGAPVYLGANGELPTGTSPAVFLTGGNPGFITNRGSGGANPVAAGALTTAGTHP